MANMKLTILGASGVNEDGDALEFLSMTTGSDAVAGRSKQRAVYWTKDPNDKKWGNMQSEDDLIFLFTLQYVDFRKQMYSPNSIEAYVLIKPLESKTVNYKAFLSKEQLNNLFATRKVSLECDEKEVCNDYYVHEFIPRKYADQMYVTLKIYSPDKMMTLEKYCRTWTAKRLGSEILASEIGNFGINRPKPKVGGSGQIDDITALEYDTTNMKHIQKDKKEHIFPYLVQYNETFYDFLARTTNRWGEFLFYEDGKLQIGYDTSVQAVENYDVMTYCGWNTSQPTQQNAGVCVDESPYDNNTLNSVVTQDGYDVVKNSILQAFDGDNGADVYWMKKAGQLLTNNKSITNFVFDTMVDDFVAVGGTALQVHLRNSNNYEEYFEKKQTIHGALPNHEEEKGKGAHYSSNSDKKETYNEFSEATPILNEKVYKTILKGELKAAENVVNIEFDTTWPNLKLGQVINVDGEKFIVVEVVGYQPETAKKSSQSYYERGYNSKIVKYRVTAVGQNADGTFFPPVLPTGHVRKSGPQIAVVVDVDDPLRANRVRVEYPWQLQTFIDSHDKDIDGKIAEEKDDDKKKELEKEKIKKYEKLAADNLKDYDVTNATPWLFYASPSGPKKAGVHARHYLAEKVMIDYANGNVERPFVVGAVSEDVPVPLKTGSAVLRAPNGEQVKVHEGLGNGAAAFIAGLTPGLKIINSFYPFSFTPDNDVSRSFEGGVEIGDKYGIWNIKGSTDGRNVSISSPWGDVMISAFTGITLSAPNGNIKIEGKNVEITAGNNLKLTSGKNIKNKFASLYDGSKKHQVLTWMADVASAVAKKVATMVASVVDLSLLRSVVELFWKPQEGTLSVSSNRFLKLEAAGATADFPAALYKSAEKKCQDDVDRNKDRTLSFGPNLTKLVKSISPMVDKMIRDFLNMHNEYIRKTIVYTNAVADLTRFSNGQSARSQNANADVAPACKTWLVLKQVVWTDGKKEITKDDVEFNGVGDGSQDDVDEEAVGVIMNNVGGLMGRHKKYFFFGSKKEAGYAKDFIVTMRKEKKEKVLKAANEILECVKAMHDLQPENVVKGVGHFTNIFRSLPKDYVNMYQEAFKRNKCGDTAFYTFINSDDCKNAIAFGNVPQMRPLALKRRVALNLVESWGAKSKAIHKKLDAQKHVVEMEQNEPEAIPAKPVTDDEFESGQYILYALSLQLEDEVTLFKISNSFGMSILDAIKENVKFWKPATEYGSWGNAKDGQILFTQGKSFYFNPTEAGVTFNNVNVAGLSRGKLSKSQLNTDDRLKFESLLKPVVEALTKIDGVAVANENPQVVVDNNEHEEQGEN
jgi:hypothetical protein